MKLILSILLGILISSSVMACEGEGFVSTGDPIADVLYMMDWTETLKANWDRLNEIEREHGLVVAVEYVDIIKLNQPDLYKAYIKRINKIEEWIKSIQ